VGTAVADPLNAFRALAGGTAIAVRVQPRASRSEVVGLHGSELRIRLTAPPVDGAANEALLRFLAEALAVPGGAVTLLSGISSRSKVVRVAGVTPEAAARALGVGP
jgi:uncharacterized protein (TIGR00251 family)